MSAPHIPFPQCLNSPLLLWLSIVWAQRTWQNTGLPMKKCLVPRPWPRGAECHLSETRA